LTEADIAEARRLLKRLARPIRTDKDSRDHENANLQLHNLIIRAARNRRLTQLYQTLNAHLTMARLHSRAADWRQRLEQEQSEHEEIVEAMERRDPKALADRMRKHILRAKQSLLQSMEKSR
jgi:DNA-binding GntR family transcriptional regulator